MPAIHIKKVDSMKENFILPKVEKERHIIFTGENGSGKSQVLKMVKTYLQECLCKRYPYMKKIEKSIAKKYGISVRLKSEKERMGKNEEIRFLMGYYDANRTIDKKDVWKAFKKHLLMLKFQEMCFKHIGKKENGDSNTVISNI